VIAIRQRNGFAVDLTRRRGVDNVKFVTMPGCKFQRIAPDKLKRVSFLRRNINSYDLIKPGAMIAHRGPTCATE
jgi:hypothetical protein